MQESGKLYASETFLKEFGLQEGDKVNIQKDDITITVEVALDDKIASGAYIGTFDNNVAAASLFDGYRFTEVLLQKV